MKIVAFLLSALLFACAAQSHPYQYGLPRGQARVVHNVVHQNVRVVATHRNHTRVAVVYRLPRPDYRHTAVVAYRPYYNPAPSAFFYGRNLHRHNAYCHH